ncbi:MAG: PDZ domain-containing protein, partial [Desulfobacterales bacterium]|nr:PDZ domain-containing protein [Desulfobacterales bacterium]
IGINTAIYAKAQGIGFAIPIDKAKRIVSDLIRYGEVIQAWIGVTVQNIDKRLATYLNVPDGKGVLIKEVIKKGPAQNAGILNGDILLSISTKKIFSNKEYNAEMRNVAAGDIIKIRILRKNKEWIFTVKTVVFPIELAMDLAHKLLGIRVKGRSMKKGVAISEINRRSYLFQIGVRTGDVIRQLDEIEVRNIKDFQKAIVHYRQKRSVVILLHRGDQGYYITVKL